MSAEDLCCFCRRLPALPDGGQRNGAAARWPLCKGRLVRTADETYRDDGDPPAADKCFKGI